MKKLSQFQKNLIAVVIAIVVTMLFMGGTVALCEWRRLHVSAPRKLAAILTFPFYMLTFIPIAVVALVSRRVTWRQIDHGAAPSSVPMKGGKASSKDLIIRGEQNVQHTDM